MSMSRNVSRNFAFIAVSNLLAPIFSLVLVLAIGRIQGVEALGKYSLLMSVFVFGMSAAGFGLPVVITRESAQAPLDAGRWFVSAVAISGALALPLLAAALVACAVWAADGADVPRAGADRAHRAAVDRHAVRRGRAPRLRARARLRRDQPGRDRGARGAGHRARARPGSGSSRSRSCSSLLRVAAALVFVLTLRRRGVQSLRLDRALFRRLAGYVPVTGLIPVVNALYARADVFVLSSLGSWRDVGLYSAALRLVDLARTVTPAYARAMYPVLARLRAAGQAEYAAAAVRATRDGLLLTLPIVVGLYGCSDLVIRLLFGADLAGAGEILRILAWAVVPFSIAIVLAQVLFAADRQAVDLGVNVVSMAVSVGSAAVLVPRFGAAGAAVAVVAASTVYATLQYAGVLRWAAPLGLGPDLLRVAVLTATALAVLWGFSWAGPIVATALALVVLGAGCLMLGLVPIDEVRRRLGWRMLGASKQERVAL